MVEDPCSVQPDTSTRFFGSEDTQGFLKHLRAKSLRFRLVRGSSNLKPEPFCVLGSSFLATTYPFASLYYYGLPPQA